MNKLNFLRPDIENLNTYLYSGIFLISIAILDVSLNSFLILILHHFYQILLVFYYLYFWEH